MVRSSKEAQLCAGIVFVASLLLYCRTLAPTVTLVDSGELIVTAHFLGVAHPPGFPLYMMLAHLASLVPWGSVALRVNAASALFAALASAMLTLVVAELMMVASSLAALKRSPKKKSGKKMPHGIGLEMERNFRLVVLAPALVSGLLLAFSRTHWSYATIAEVYTLNTLLILSVFFLTLRWRRRIMEDERRVTADVNRPRAVGITDYDSLLNAAALGFGLALGVHHVTVGLILPALAIIVYKTEGAAFFTSRRLLYAALFSIAGLCAVYSYLPLAASGDAVINWGRPRSLQEIWSHFIGRQYQNYFSFAPEMLGRQVLAFGELACRQFGRWWLPLALVLAGAGVSYAFKRDRTTFWFLAPIAFANVAYTLGYDIAEDKDAYYLPTFVAVATAAGYGLRSLFEFALSRRWSTQKIHLLAAFLVVLVPAIALASNWPFNNRRQYFIAQDYVENIQSAIAPNGLLLTLDWQVQAPMLYTREVEQHRRDVKVVDINLLRRSWYFDYLQRAYPDLLERSRQKVDRFVVELQLWEPDPEAYRTLKLTGKTRDSRNESSSHSMRCSSRS